MIINVSAGHNSDGKIACGAIGYIRESTEARRVKNEVIQQLKRLGHEVHDCTCENGVSQADVLSKIVTKCNAHKVDLDVSIHFNAGAKDSVGNKQTTGTEVFLFSAGSQAKRYAEGVVKAISGLGFKNRGVKTNPNLYYLRKTKAPSMLIECCFVDDKDDVALYDYQEMASAIVRGICGINPPIQEDRSDIEAAWNDSETQTGLAMLYRVQVGAYMKEINAKDMQAELKAKGFDSIIVKS